MNLPFLTASRQKKLRDTLSAIRLVRSIEPTAAAFEALFFISDAFLSMYRISLFDWFLDATVNYIRAVDAFYLGEYFQSASFLFFLKLATLWLVINALSSLKDYLHNRLEVRFASEMPAKVIAKLSSLNLEDVESKELQDLLSKVNSYSMERILDTYWRARQVIYHLTKIFSAAFFVLRINTLLPLGAFLLVLPEILYKYRAKKGERTFLDGAIDKKKYADYIYTQAVRLRNFPELKVDGIFKFLLNTREVVTRELTEGISRKRFDQYIKGFLFAVLDQFFFRALLIGLVMLAVLRRLTVGVFQALFQYMINLYDASFALWDRLSIISDNAQYVGDYFAFANFVGFGDVSTGDKVIKSAVPEIKVRDLTFAYLGRGKPIVKNLNFKIKPGEKVAFVGGDSSGKTTIVKLLCGLYRIRKGDILYDGVSIRDLKRGELKDKVSVLFENFVKYDLSIRENITLSAAGRAYDPSLYRRVLEVTLLNEWLKEEGLSDSRILGKLFAKGVEISSGYWQRIAIARTLYRNRPIFIMDEPLVFVDGPTQKRILGNVLEFVGEGSLMMTLHSMEDAKFFGRVLMVEDGGVREVNLNS